MQTPHKIMPNRPFASTSCRLCVMEDQSPLPRSATTKPTRICKKILKQNLRQKVKESSKRLVFYFDKARFGAHSKIGHTWLETGKRNPMPIKIGKNVYLYRAVEPSTGRHFTLELPFVNTDCLIYSSLNFLSLIRTMKFCWLWMGQDCIVRKISIFPTPLM